VHQGKKLKIAERAYLNADSVYSADKRVLTLFKYNRSFKRPKDNKYFHSESSDLNIQIKYPVFMNQPIWMEEQTVYVVFLYRSKSSLIINETAIDIFFA